MATSSRIGIEKEDGTIESIYCHFDGYLEHTGQILYQHYSSREKVQELVDLGDISSLREDIGEKHDFYDMSLETWTKAYGRDRGEKDVEKRVDNSVEFYNKSSSENFGYLFTIKDEWLVRGNKLEEFESLKEVLEKTLSA